MSKRLKEVLADRLHFSFLETIENDSCTFSKALNITVRELMEDGTPWLHEALRHVLICHSQDVCTHYDIAIDPTTGIGSITIEDISAVQLSIVQVDDDGVQMINEDDYKITYKVNGEASGMDYARITFQESDSETVNMEIINQPMARTSLVIEKALRDMDGGVIDFDPQMEFPVTIVDPCGCEQQIILSQENQFRKVLENLHVASYTIYEEAQREYAIQYCFNGVPAMDTQFAMER